MLNVGLSKKYGGIRSVGYELDYSLYRSDRERALAKVSESLPSLFLCVQHKYSSRNDTKVYII